MRYLIDGYNLLFRLPPLKLSLEGKREALIEEFQQLAGQFNLTLSLVFDGSQTPLPYAVRHHRGDLEIVYTQKEQSADEYLLEEIEQARNRKEITVVTSDAPLAQKCRHLGAYSQTIREFLQFLQKKKEGIKTSPSPYQESSFHMQRLLTLFEKKLEEKDSDDLFF